MLEVTVKTLDSQNHSFSVPDDSTVKEFKEQISPILNISVDKQRLIFCGKVLKDDKKLSEYDVNGKVIHVVQSLPPQGNGTSTSSSSNSTAGGSRSGHRDAAGFLLGAFTIPQDLIDPTQVQNIVQEVVSGMGEIGRNATVMSRTSDDGSSVDVHINLGPLQSEAQLRMNRVQTMLIRANRLLESLEDGTNSNNGGNSADSSSQTDNENDELRSSPMEAEVGSSGGPDNDIANNGSSDSPINNGVNIDDSDISSPLNLINETTGRVPPISERYRFEGLAHAAQAAISAAFATAAAAARAATASVSAPMTANTGVLGANCNARSTATEPMDSSAADSTASNFLNSGNISSSTSSEDTSTVVVNSEITIPPPECEPFVQESQQSNSQPKPDAASCSGNTESSGASASGTTPNNGSVPTRREAVQPSVQTLANLLDEVIRVNTRLEPCLERCRDLIRSDPPLSGRQLGDAHRLFSRISQLLHFLSHAFHSLSDLHINFSQTPPRSPRVRIISSTHTTSILHGIPVQAQISISTSSNAVPNSSRTTTTTANNSTPDSTQNSTTEARPAPRVINQIPVTVPLTATSSAATSIPAVLRNQNPVVFMEVSPGTITIDSISAMDAAVGNTTGTSQTAAPTPNRENTAPLQTEQNASNPSSTRSTATNISIPSLTGQAHPMINMPFRNLIPVPLTSMGSLHTFDSGLPCHSVWALEPSRRRHNAGGSRSSPAVQVGVTPNVPGRQDEQLQHVINSMLSLLNHGNGQASGNAASPSFTMVSSNGADGDTRLVIDTRGNQGNRDRMSRTDNSGNTVAGSVDSESPQSSPTALADEMFLEVVENILSTTSDHHHQSIAEILSHSHNTIEFDVHDIAGNLLWFIAGQLSFQDLLEITSGNSQSLTRIKEPLQNYVQQKIFHSVNPQPSDIDAIVRQISNDLDVIVQSFVGNINVRPGVNYTDTLSSFFRRNLSKLFDAVLNPPDSIPFGENLFKTCKAFFLEFLSVHNCCAEDSNRTLERIALERLNFLISGISTPLRLAVLSWASRLILNSDGNFQRLLDDISAHNEDNPVTVERNAIPTTDPNVSNRSSKDMKTNNAVGRENHAETLRAADTITTENRAAPTLAAFARIAECTSAFLRNNTRSNSQTPGPGLTEVVIGSEAWHNTLPRDWVPIIARDVQRQRRQAPQPPFSNAYLSGMPSKRRKIMTNGAPTLLGHSQNTLSDMLLQAISNANVKPLSSVEEVKKDASQDIPLQTAFNMHMKNVIQERLQRDLDYCSERFPNSEKYYNLERL